MDIHSIRLRATSQGGSRLSAQVADQEIQFTFTRAPTSVRRSYDPFVVAGFMKAMEAGESLLIAGDAPVSPELEPNLRRACWIYEQWWDDITTQPLHSQDSPKETTSPDPFVGTFFSGGVDSVYSYLRNKEEVTHLILCRGLDISFEEVDRWERTVELVRDFADREGKGLVLVESNVKLLQSKVKSRNHGAILISTALGLGFRKLIVPASVSLDQMLPWGSHPMLDPHFSNGVSEISHDAPFHRTTKIRRIVEADLGLDQLRVCNVFTRDVNCGICEKCLRTRTTLTLLGAETAHLKPIRDARELRKVRLSSAGHLGGWRENLILAQETGHEELADEIGRMIRRFQTKEALMQLDEDYLGGALLNLLRRLRPR